MRIRAGGGQKRRTGDVLPHSLGSYQNYADCGENNRAQRLENYFAKANIQRLKELKEEYDPLGTFTREHLRL